MSESVGYNFEAKLKDGEELLWTGKGSGRNLSLRIVIPMMAIALLGLFLVLGFPLSGFQSEMAMVSLWALAISAIGIWFFRARMLGPEKEEYAISTQRIFIVSGPIGRVCRPYSPSAKKRSGRSGWSFYAIKHIRKRNTVVFLPVRSKSFPQGYPPVFVGVPDSKRVAELAAKTFNLKLILR